MKGYRLWALVVIIFLYALPISTATPYWVKPGVYIEYIAQRYDPYIETQISHGTKLESVTTASILYFRNGTEYWVDSYNDTLIKFKILGESGEYFVVGVIIELKNVTIKFSLHNGTSAPAFWESTDMLSTSKRVSADGEVSVKVKLRSLRIFGEYRIRKRDGMVFGIDGRPYGHTFLWINPNETPKGNDTFVVLPTLNWTMKVERVSAMDKPKKTYYGEFGPPTAILSLMGPPLVIKGRLEFTTQTPGGICYDPATGMVLSPTTLSILISPDLAAIGIPFASFMDERVAYDQMVKGNPMWAGLLPLYDTNAEFQRVEEVPFSKAKTPWKYAFYIALTVLGVIAGTRGRGLPKR
ncbi:hypothetical protein [Thermococcus sp.]